MGLIQTPDQLRFSYMAVLEGAKYIMGDSSVQVAAPHTPSLSLILTHSRSLCDIYYKYFFPATLTVCLLVNPETPFSPIFPVGVVSYEKDSVNR